MKLSSFGDVILLRRLNEFQNVLRLIEDHYHQTNGEKKYEEYLKKLNEYNLSYLNISEKDIANLIEFFEQENLKLNSQRTINPFDFSVHETFLFPNEPKSKEILNFLKSKFSLKNEEIQNLISFSNTFQERLNEVFSHAIKNECSLMIDAEQSYIQHHFDYFTAYVFRIYNKNNAVLSATLQCYLKNQMFRLEKIEKFCRGNNLKIGIKLVRGAYMMEENNLANENKYPSPICSSFEETNSNYDRSLERVFRNLKEGEKVE